MWLRAETRKQSTMRRTKNDNIATQANICYDSTVFSDHHDEEFHEYDDVVYHTSVSAHDSVFGDYQNEDYYDIVNRGTSVSGKGRPFSSQCESGNRMPGRLASSVRLIEVPREYEIPVHSNSVYEIRDTLNDYEN